MFLGLSHMPIMLLLLGLSPMPIILAVKHRCDWCKAQNVDCFRCSRCSMVRYCSRECQKKHWKNGHQPMCDRWEALGRALDSSEGSTVPDDDETFLRWYYNHIYMGEVPDCDNVLPSLFTQGLSLMPGGSASPWGLSSAPGVAQPVAHPSRQVWLIPPEPRDFQAAFRDMPPVMVEFLRVFRDAYIRNPDEELLTEAMRAMIVESESTDSDEPLRHLIQVFQALNVDKVLAGPKPSKRKKKKKKKGAKPSEDQVLRAQAEADAADFLFDARLVKVSAFMSAIGFSGAQPSSSGAASSGAEPSSSGGAASSGAQPSSSGAASTGAWPGFEHATEALRASSGAQPCRVCGKCLTGCGTTVCRRAFGEPAPVRYHRSRVAEYRIVNPEALHTGAEPCEHTSSGLSPANPQDDHHILNLLLSPGQSPADLQEDAVLTALSRWSAESEED